MKNVLIVNPKSGNGKSIEIGKYLENELKKTNIQTEIYYTKYKGDTSYIKEKVSDNDIIYSIGGDGTVNEIINSIVGTNKRLCVIPAGSGNDFYKTLLESNLKQDEKIDVGLVNNNYFINTFSIGIDADICDNTKLFRKNYISRSIVYDLSLLYTFFNYKSKEMNLFDKNKLYTLLTISNGRYYGGGFKINPESLLNDGLLNLITIDDTNKLHLIKLLLKIIKMENLNDDIVCKKTIKNMSISSDYMLNACLDGEQLISNNFNISVIPKAITIHKDNNINIKKLIKK